MTRAERDDRIAALKMRYPNQFPLDAPAWQFDVMPGWLAITECVCEAIQRILDRDTKLAAKFEWRQWKEKFGGLRLYYSSLRNAEILKVIEEAERQSVRTCCLCGRPGRIRTDRPWTLTLCDNHSDFPGHGAIQDDVGFQFWTENSSAGR